MIKPNFKKNKRFAIKTYVVYATLGLLSSSLLAYAAVNIPSFQDNTLLSASDLNSKINELVKHIDALEAKVGSSATSLVALTGKVSITATSDVIDGSGTHFDQELRIGDAISVAGEIHKITAIESPVRVTTDALYSVDATDIFAYVDGHLLSARDMLDNEWMYVDKRGNTIINGNFIPKIAVASGRGTARTGDGVIPSRTVTINKALDASKLRLMYSDTMGFGANGGECNWEFLVDNAACSGGRTQFLAGSASVNVHNPSTLLAYCSVPAGSHTITMTVFKNGGATGCTVNFGSGSWTLEAQEVVTN